jgi:hypothetical protein
MTVSSAFVSSSEAQRVTEVLGWIDGGPAAPHTTRRGDVMNPSTGAVIRKVALADAVDVDRAVESAARALPGWRATTPLRRARILTRFRELLEIHRHELAALISEEHGKVFLDAVGSVQRGIEVVEFACGAPHLLKGAFSESVGQDVDAYSLTQPVGVCVGITPFNFPVMVPLWMFPVALACGNTFVLKPSEKDPSPSIRWRSSSRSRAAGRRLQRRARRQGSGRRALAASEGGRDLLRRIDTDRPLHLLDGGRDREARAGAGRREESRGGPAGRRRGTGR